MPILQARSIAGGAIPAADHAALEAEILAGLETARVEAPLGGVVLDMRPGTLGSGEADRKVDGNGKANE